MSVFIPILHGDWHIKELLLQISAPDSDTKHRYKVISYPQG